jgi:hypothetical protein
MKTVESLAAARAVNFGKVADVAAPAPAELVKPPKFSNLKRLNVYGYDTADGRVPKDGKIVLIPGFVGVPKGVKEDAWKAVVEFAGKTVREAYDSRTVDTSAVRRSYRAGAIRFVLGGANLESESVPEVANAEPELVETVIEAPAETVV